jgi:hypothetical protein
MKLENTLIIVADLGELKVYKPIKHEAIVNGGHELKVSYSLELLNDLDYIAPHKKISDIVSDKAGNFKGGNVEDNKIEDEIEKRTLKDVANDIEAIVKNEKPKQLFLAFPKEMHPSLMDELSAETKALIVKNLQANLVKEDKNKLLTHFSS